MRNQGAERVQGAIEIISKKRDEWVEKLRKGKFEVEPGKELVVPEGTIERFLDYLDNRDADLEVANAMLRTKEDALAFCETLKFKVGMTATKLEGWTDTPQAMVAAVTGIAAMVCADKTMSLNSKPDRRCLWLAENHLHVTARNLDGAVPALANPKIVWEIKEYWGARPAHIKLPKFPGFLRMIALENQIFPRSAGRFSLKTRGI